MFVIDERIHSKLGESFTSITDIDHFLIENFADLQFSNINSFFNSSLIYIVRIYKISICLLKRLKLHKEPDLIAKSQ